MTHAFFDDSGIFVSTAVYVLPVALTIAVPATETPTEPHLAKCPWRCHRVDRIRLVYGCDLQPCRRGIC